MATKVYETVELELLDGTNITVKPLNLKNLRALMKEWSKAANVENEDEFIDVLVACTKIAIKQIAPSLLDPEDIVEEVIDLQTMYKILEVAAEIKLNDPNLLAAAQGVLGTN